MFTKWIIEGLEGYSFGEDYNLYKDPYTDSGNNYRDWRLIKTQYPNRWRINNEWYSKTQLKTRIIKDPNPREIFKTK